MKRKNPLDKTRRHPDNFYPKTGAKTGRNTGKKRRMSRRQTGGFLNCYDFAYAGRDTVNQLGKIAPGIINKATSDIKLVNRELIRQSEQVGQK